MFVAEAFVAKEGKYVPVEETIRGFREILEGNTTINQNKHFTCRQH